MLEALNKDFEMELKKIAEQIDRINRDDASHNDGSPKESVVFTKLSETSPVKKSMKDYYLRFL